MKKRWFLKLINFWPPFRGAGIRVTHLDADMRHIRVELRPKLFNRNYVGVHFGGSLFAMTDPFFMLILIENLGPDFVVWDKAATIRYKRPGRGIVTAEFQISAEEVAAVRADAIEKTKIERTYNALIKDEKGTVVAEVDKLLHIRFAPKP